MLILITMNLLNFLKVTKNCNNVPLMQTVAVDDDLPNSFVAIHEYWPTQSAVTLFMYNTACLFMNRAIIFSFCTIGTLSLKFDDVNEDS